jgi:serine protease Do
VRSLPDWLIYAIALLVVLATLFGGEERADAPEAPPPIEGLPPTEDLPAGPALPAASPFDEGIIVEAGTPHSGIGTAFGIAREGWWLTARHVVEGCDQVGLASGGYFRSVDIVKTSEAADLALLRTGRAPEPVTLAASETLTLGEAGFMIGYPQGRPGEAYAKLVGRAWMVTQGSYSVREPVLAWAETGRTRGLQGSLGGMSGGPVFDAEGRVVGVTVAESLRRGRIYSAAPESVMAYLGQETVPARGASVGPITSKDYGGTADRLRRELAVVKVGCAVD